MDVRLNYRSKLRLVGTILTIYIPIILFVDFPVYSRDLTYTLAIFRYQLASVTVVAIVLFAWVDVSERVIHGLANKLGEDFLFQFKLTALILLGLLAVTMAMTFIFASHGLMTVANVVTHQLTGASLTLPYPTDESPAFFRLYERANIALLILMMLGSFYLIANGRINARVKFLEIREAQLQREHAKAELSALKDQLSPHFFFNSLSILASLVNEQPDLSRQFIQELSKTYRYLLEQRDADVVNLQEELAFIRSYIFLLGVRFGNRMQVRFDIDNASAEGMIPPMSLQLLIENAVRHNQMSDEEPLDILLHAKDGMITVSNNIRRRPEPSHSTGTGLPNIARRYSLMTNRTVKISEHEGRFTVSLPLLLAHDLSLSNPL